MTRPIPTSCCLLAVPVTNCRNPGFWCSPITSFFCRVPKTRPQFTCFEQNLTKSLIQICGTNEFSSSLFRNQKFQRFGGGPLLRFDFTLGRSFCTVLRFFKASYRLVTTYFVFCAIHNHSITAFISQLISDYGVVFETQPVQLQASSLSADYRDDGSKFSPTLKSRSTNIRNDGYKSSF